MGRTRANQACDKICCRWLMVVINDSSCIHIIMGKVSDKNNIGQSAGQTKKRKLRCRTDDVMRLGGVLLSDASSLDLSAPDLFPSMAFLRSLMLLIRSDMNPICGGSAASGFFCFRLIAGALSAERNLALLKARIDARRSLLSPPPPPMGGSGADVVSKLEVGGGGGGGRPEDGGGGGGGGRPEGGGGGGGGISPDGGGGGGRSPDGGGGAPLPGTPPPSPAEVASISGRLGRNDGAMFCTTSSRLTVG